MAASPTLPDPDACPDRDVVIFDGHCHFCQGQVSKLVWMDKWSGMLGCARRLSFLSLHDSRVAQRYPELSHEMLMEQMYVVSTSGRKYGGADAVRYLSRRIPLLWPAAIVLHIPGSARLWRWIYHQIARQRYRWNRDTCDNGACSVHFGAREESKPL